MGRLRLFLGALGIILGFFVYQYGFFLTYALKLPDSLASWTMTYLPWIGSDYVAISGAALQLFGGVIAIAGLLTCISWVGSQPGAALSVERRNAAKPVAPISDSSPKCKFCGAVMESGAAFCPSCQRAQA
jgi:hypothetical protein